MQRLVSSFYKYIRIKNPFEIQKSIADLCSSLELKGRVLIGEEGINGSVFGEKDSIRKFEEEIAKKELFSDISFKEQLTEVQAFRKLIIRVRKEIVHFGIGVDLSNTAPFVSPKELNELIEEESVVLLDARNDYESRIGKFRNAVALNIRNFRDLPNAINDIGHLKNKKIVTYCTGGIRCEKASAFLRERGFNDVMQLRGGILAYGKEFPDSHWEGKCFVFDDRIAISINKNDKMLSGCEWCGENAEEYTNCHNRDCDRLFISCEKCIGKHNASCSLSCESAPRRRNKGMIISYPAILDFHKA